MPHVASEGLCRGEGQGYVALAVEGHDGPLWPAAHASDGTEAPAALFPLDGVLAGPVRHVAFVVPLLLRDLTLELWASPDHGGTPIWSGSFPVNMSKLSSRLLSARKPQVAQALRGIEDRRGSGSPRLRVSDIWPAGHGPADDSQAIWRVQATFPTADTAPARLVAWDPHLERLPLEVSVMEDHVVPSVRDPHAAERVVTFSARLPREADHVCLVASVGDGGDHSAFRCLLPWQVGAKVDEGRRRVGGATWDDRYPAWLEAHRATPAELGRQRALEPGLGPAAPRLSIVMPVYRTPSPLLAEAIASVRAQTYPNWELVLVNASGAWQEVTSVLATVADDPRVRILAIENRSIAENTNEGIAATTGDYVAFLDHDDLLEPDALWRYAEEVREHPETDLLYCDEDRLTSDGVPHMPAFKPGPNHGLLLGYNYMTHLLCVSRRVLDMTERSGADVAGAQDYDLALRAFEVARRVAHVPHVLYHWREHESSTAGGADQKPYAHEAGRVALAGHLRRTGRDAVVEDGPLPCTYRARFALPNPTPLVSVIIPTRDHADLLRTCVASILERTSYPSYEVVLVENGSTRQETFALYDELCQSDPRVHLATWRPAPDAGDAAFNYSAVVNEGARHASGDLLVFLNNDTEVIADAWMDELVRCFGRREVGVAGAKLVYDDGLIQHVGMAANPNGDFYHMSQNLAHDEMGYAFTCGLAWDPPMVTGACQMVRRSTFDGLGGYDEGLAVGYNDGDLCLRAREAGWTVTFTPGALLRHREFASRGREETDLRLRARYLAERARFAGRHASRLAAGDPAINPNLDPFSPWFELGWG